MIGNPNPFTFIGPTKTELEYRAELGKREEALVAKESEAAMLKRENAQWLRFFEVAVPLTWLAEFASMDPEQRMKVAGDEADAMLEEAKKRGRV